MSSTIAAALASVVAVRVTSPRSRSALKKSIVAAC